MRFLCFRLYAPLCSFGDVAVGQQRPSLSSPSRSAVVGLIAACLGIRREDARASEELENAVGVATRTDAIGSLLLDYHTAQAPDQVRFAAYRKRHGLPPSTRREELSATFDRDGRPHELETQLSQRQYRTDAAFVVCLWLRDDTACVTLEVLGDHLRHPVFVPYLGRKAAALAAPFEPTIVEAADPVEALRQVRFKADGSLARVTERDARWTFRWEGKWPGLFPITTETRRDRVADRMRWQFLTREENVLSEAKCNKEVVDVPEHV